MVVDIRKKLLIRSSGIGIISFRPADADIPASVQPNIKLKNHRWHRISSHAHPTPKSFLSAVSAVYIYPLCCDIFKFYACAFDRVSGSFRLNDTRVIAGRWKLSTCNRRCSNCRSKKNYLS